MADDRTYIKLHDGILDHPKIDPLSDAAFRLLIGGWCWCSRHLTDGKMPAVTWGKRGTARARAELVAAGLVILHGETVEFHDYLQHQRSAAQVAAMKEQRRSAGRAGGLANSKRPAQRFAKRLAEQTASEPSSKTEAETEGSSNEEPQERADVVARKRATPPPDEFPLTAELRAWGREHAPLVTDPVAETRQFLDHHRAKGSTMKDWTAAWRTWMGNAQKYATQRGGTVTPLRNDLDPHTEWARMTR